MASSEESKRKYHLRVHGIAAQACPNCRKVRVLQGNGKCKRCNASLGLKHCPRCKNVLPKFWFYRGQTACKGCRRNARNEAANINNLYLPEGTRKWDTAMAKKKTKSHPRKFLGWWAPGEKDKANALRASVKACNLCESTNPISKNGFAADHNHETGMFRGFLCQGCNVVIGYIEKHGLKIQDQRFYDWILKA